MKALLCLEFGPLEGLALEEVSSPIAGNGKVVVAVKAAGVKRRNAQNAFACAGTGKTSRWRSTARRSLRRA